MSLRKKNINIIVYLIGNEFLLHPQPLLSQYKLYMSR